MAVRLCASREYSYDKCVQSLISSVIERLAIFGQKAEVSPNASIKCTDRPRPPPRIYTFIKFFCQIYGVPYKVAVYGFFKEIIVYCFSVGYYVRRRRIFGSRIRRDIEGEHVKSYSHMKITIFNTATRYAWHPYAA